MTNAKTTKRALFTSCMSMLLCVSMLIGSTFAWFTDSVSTAKNIITAGNLDVELYYMNDETADWTKVDAETNVFKENTLWEPGHTEVVKLKVVNEGTLALKYLLSVNIASETGSYNVAGKEFKLSDYIKYAVIDGEQGYTSSATAAEAAEEAGATALNVAYSSVATELRAEADKVVTMVVYMPETVGNEANYGKDEVAPQIELGINLAATQQTYEEDSFGPEYDKDSEYFIEATTAADAATILTNGGTLNITEPLTLDGGLAVNADATLTNGTISNPTTSYAFSANEGTFTIEDATYEGSAGLSVNGGELVINGGTYHVSGNNSSSRHTFYVAEGKAIINGGTFTRSNNPTDGFKRGATIYAGEGTEVVINGGSFAKGHSKTGNIIGSGKVTIYGGTFEFDPTPWLADGYTATQGADGWWTVSAQ